MAIEEARSRMTPRLIDSLYVEAMVLADEARMVESGTFDEVTCSGGAPTVTNTDEITARLTVPGAGRIFFIRYAMLAGMTQDEIYDLTRIDDAVKDGSFASNEVLRAAMDAPRVHLIGLVSEQITSLTYQAVRGERRAEDKSPG